MVPGLLAVLVVLRKDTSLIEIGAIAAPGLIKDGMLRMPPRNVPAFILLHVSAQRTWAVARKRIRFE